MKETTCAYCLSRFVRVGRKLQPYCSAKCYLANNTKPAANGCIEWQGLTNAFGYGRAHWRGPYVAHRLTYETHVGVIPDGLIVRHKCDNPRCCNPLHLELGTYADNNGDCRKRGRHRYGTRTGRNHNHALKGEAHQNAKLTFQQCQDIRASNSCVKALAKQYGVHKVTIYGVRAGTRRLSS